MAVLAGRLGLGDDQLAEAQLVAQLVGFQAESLESLHLHAQLFAQFIQQLALHCAIINQTRKRESIMNIHNYINHNQNTHTYMYMCI